MKHLLAVATLSLLGSTAALADENPGGFYVGLGVGQFNVEVENVGDVEDVDFDGDDNAFKVFAGWRFLPFLALEVAYIDFGQPSERVEDFELEADVKGIAPYLVGTLPIGPVELFAKVGYLFYDYELGAEDIEDRLDESSEDLVYAAGLGFTFFEHLNASVEYEIIDVSEVDDANAVWLTGAWRF